MIIDDLNILLAPKTDISPILNIFIKRAVTFILNYLNNSKYNAAYIEENFSDAVIELVYNAYSIKGKENIQEESQGSRSITYKGFTNFAEGTTFRITNDIKALLPLPSIRMRG